MNHSTSKLWNKFQLLLRRMRWPWMCGCGKVSGVYHIGWGEQDVWHDAVCVETKLKSYQN